MRPEPRFIHYSKRYESMMCAVGVWISELDALWSATSANILYAKGSFYNSRLQLSFFRVHVFTLDSMYLDCPRGIYTCTPVRLYAVLLCVSLIFLPLMFKYLGAGVASSDGLSHDAC